MTNPLPVEPDPVPPPGHGLRHYLLVHHRENWLQLFKFCLVGGSGMAVNLVVFWICSAPLDVAYLLASCIAFVVANSSNYVLNRIWTFSSGLKRRSTPTQYGSFLAVGAIGQLITLAILAVLVEAGDLWKPLAQLIAIVIVTPLTFLGNKLWTFNAREL